MGGLEKIIDSIAAEAKGEADEINQKALAEIAEIKLQCKKESEKLKEENVRKTQEECMNLSASVEAAADAQARELILSTKNKIIADVLDEIKTDIENMGADEYFEFLSELLENNDEDEAGTIYFNERDSSRIPESFKAKLSDKKLTLSDECVDIDGGFIIKYGKIDINCSISGIFEDKKNTLSDIINRFM